jgi:hypothetical protein
VIEMPSLVTATSKSFSYFFFFYFFTGFLSLWYEYYTLYIPPAFVFIYSITLLIAQNKYYVSLSVDTKNSPYFLGFLFTLAALFKIFMDLPELSGIDKNAISFLVPQIGTALSTTIVGLVLRHVILSFDPASEQQEHILRAATDELKENVSAYKKAQQKLLDLIETFVKHHNEILEAEQKASKDHLNFLSESSDALNKISKTYPQNTKKLNAYFDNMKERMDYIIEDNIPDIQKQLLAKTTSNLEKLGNDFTKFTSKLYDDMNLKLIENQKKLDVFSSNLNNSLEEVPKIQTKLLEEGIKRLRDFQNTFIDSFKDSSKKSLVEMQDLLSNLKIFSGSFHECSSIINNDIKPKLSSISHDYNSLSSDLKTSNETISNTNSTLSNALSNLKEGIISFDKLTLQKLQIFQKELVEVDKLIHSFVEIMKKRLAG